MMSEPWDQVLVFREGIGKNKKARDNKVPLTPEQLAQLENIFIEYNEVMGPNSLEDSVPIRVMRLEL